MAFETERENILQIVDQHAKAPMVAAHSAPVAAAIVRRCAVLKIKPPLVIRRFQDREEGPKGHDGVLDKLSRDFHGKEYSELNTTQKAEIDSHRSLLSNGGLPVPYTQPGFTFAQGHHLLLATYREESTKDLPPEIRAAMIDFRKGLEKDLDEAAKHAGFFKEYSDANTALKIATAGPHSARQNIPIVTSRR